MASFTNFATLSYNGGTTNSNTVTGELLEALTVTKTAVVKNYAANDYVYHFYRKQRCAAGDKSHGHR